MKKSYIIIGAIVLVVIIFYSMFKSSYNEATIKGEEVISSWAQVENAYQRRSDLIPNLVNSVKGAVAAEKEILVGVMDARASASRIQIDPNKLTAENIKNFQGAQDGISQALGRLMMVTENYPQLQSIGGFTDLRAELAGTENRIATERGRFNETTLEYNKLIKQFPFNIFAKAMGFEPKAYFEAQPGSNKVPEVKF
jgi:LemA protein